MVLLGLVCVTLLRRRVRVRGRWLMLGLVFLALGCSKQASQVQPDSAGESTTVEAPANVTAPGTAGDTATATPEGVDAGMDADAAGMEAEVVKDPCGAPKKVGPCKARKLRYFFDAATRACAEFYWGGCQPGPNQFKTLEACQATCGK